MARRGRPTDDPKTGVVQIRMTADVDAWLRKSAESQQTTKTEIVLRALKLLRATEKAGSPDEKQPA